MWWQRQVGSEVMEMMSGGSGPSLLHYGGGEHLEEDERKRGVFDARRGGTNCEDGEVRRCPWEEAGSVIWRTHTSRKSNVELGPRGGGQQRASRRRGRHLREQASSVTRRMYATLKGKSGGTHLYWPRVQS
jgi:hypothetical protein